MSNYEDINFIDQTKSVWNYSLFTNEIISLFQQGKCFKMHKYLGNHRINVYGKKGIYFAVWAPNATFVSVIGNFNHWEKKSHPLFVRLDNSGIWEGFIPNLAAGEIYKYHIINTQNNSLDKGDPYCHFWERKPKTASITWNCEYDWQDEDYMKTRAKKNSLDSPFSVYEVHLGSWKKPNPNDDESYLTYREMAVDLVEYVVEMGFTHVEFMPVMEHPFDGSWGYQGTGFFAPTSRYGTPQEFAFLIESFHKKNIGVILDWVPSHFPYDAHGLFMFDGFNTYEYADPRKGYHPDWKSYVFNYGRGEVRSFLLSSAFFWLETFHIDGLRVDAVSSLLRLDYSRNKGEWEPNQFGGNGNIEAIEFVKNFNYLLYQHFKDIQIIAEESTDWPKISKPIYDGGMGFGMKWMMGWMHDTLNYFKIDPLYRGHHQDKFSFSMMYYYDENFMLPLSHDEVVHGKSPMIYKMPGDEWQKFANLKILYTYMFTHPGGKLLFMGNEFASTFEWNYKTQLPWYLLEFAYHQSISKTIKQLNKILVNYPSLYLNQFKMGNFEWVDLYHKDESIICYKRKNSVIKEELFIILNLTPINRLDYTLEFLSPIRFELIFNTDSQDLNGVGFLGKQLDFYSTEIDGKHYFKINLPALSALILKLHY